MGRLLDKADCVRVLPIGYWRHPRHVTWLHSLLFAASVAQIRRERPRLAKCARNRAEIFALPIKGATNDYAVVVGDCGREPPTRHLQTCNLLRAPG